MEMKWHKSAEIVPMPGKWVVGYWLRTGWVEVLQRGIGVWLDGFGVDRLEFSDIPEPDYWMDLPPFPDEEEEWQTK